MPEGVQRRRAIDVGRRLPVRAVVHLAFRIVPERAVFFDDPAIVLDIERRIGGMLVVIRVHRQARSRGEGDRHGRRRQRSNLLGVAHIVGKGVGARCSRLRRERAIRVDRKRHRRARRHGDRRQIDLQDFAGRIRIIAQNAGHGDRELLGIGGSERVIAHHRRTGEYTAILLHRRVALVNSGRMRRGAIDGEGERTGARAGRWRRIGKRAVRIELQARSIGQAGFAHNGDTIGANDTRQDAGIGVTDLQRRIDLAVVLLVGVARKGALRPDRTADADLHATGHIQVGLHAAVALAVGRQAELTIENRIARGRVIATNHLRTDRDVMRFTGSEKDFALYARIARQHVAVFRKDRGLQPDDGRDVHAQAGVDVAQQHFAARGHDRSARGGWRQHRRGRGSDVAAVKGNAIHQVVTRRVVDRGRVAGMHRRIAALARQTHPRREFGETAGAHGGVDRSILHRIDLA